MRRVLLLAGTATLLASGPALAQEGGVIRGGEHGDFSRIVLRVDPRTEWSLETGDGRVTLLFPGKALRFDADGVFDRMPRSRVAAVESLSDGDGTRVTVSLGCECRVSTTFVDGRYLALDVADRDGPTPIATAAPPPESPTARANREATAVASAEEVLLEQIERAAKQGVVDLSAPPSPEAPEPIPAARPRIEPVALARPKAEPVPRPAPAAPADLGGLEHSQIFATTVFDRDKPRSAKPEPEAAPECLPDDSLDVAHWSRNGALFDQVPALELRLVGEFDTPDPTALGDLARLYIRFGFGAEAEGLLLGFDAPLPERAALLDLARVVDGKPVAPDGPLAVGAPCPGRHALWLALGGAVAPWRDADQFAAVLAAFAELPPDLRALLGPALELRLVDAHQPGPARQIQDLTERPGLPPSIEMQLAEASLTAAEGRTREAADALGALAAASTPVAPEALARLTRLALDRDLPLPATMETDLRTAALEARRGPREATLRGLLAEVLAREGTLAAAIAETRAAAADLPDAAPSFDALAASLLAAADPAKVGDAAYAEVMLADAPLIATTAAGDPARRAIAARLLGLGLPEAALTLLAPPVARGDGDARLLAAEAELRLGHAALAEAMLAGIDGTEAATLRARALAQGGAFGQASGVLQAAGLGAAAAPYAWPSGDWALAGAATDDPQRAAMAGYMAARSGGAEPPAPATDPAALDPAAAFQQPLPSLDRPSLASAKRLLATGPKVEGFIQTLLAKPAAPAP